MLLLPYRIVVFILLMLISLPAAAADSTNCSYSTRVKQGEATFDISSSPVLGCAVQVVNVKVRRGGQIIAHKKVDVDYLARAAQSVDLTSGGNPALAVFSRAAGVIETEALDVYWLDRTTLRRAIVPDLADKNGYRGGDRFTLTGRRIVRTVPVYRKGDPNGQPTGGIRSITYEFRNGALHPHDQPVSAVETAALPKAKEAAQHIQPTQPTQPTPVVKTPAGSGPVTRAVTGITVVRTGIEIHVSGPVDAFKIMKLEKPERLAIDIPDAYFTLAGKKTSINRFGLSRARVGRNKDFLRIVFDTDLARFPKYHVTSSVTGILIEFTQ